MEIEDLRLKGLRRFNLFMAFLHFAQGAVIIFISKDFRLPVTTGFLEFNPLSQTLDPATKQIAELPLAWLVVIFLFLSAFAHLIISTVYNKRYNENLQQGINKARWIEYSFSAALMMVGIAMLAGIYDLAALIMIFSLIAIMNLLGLVMEAHNQALRQALGQSKVSWLSYWIGCLAGIVPWVVVAIFFWGAHTYGTGQIPSFVYWIYATIFVFFNCFALNMVLQYKKVGRWSDYLFGERVYVILSLVAKSALAWQLFAGTLRP